MPQSSTIYVGLDVHKERYTGRATWSPAYLQWLSEGASPPGGKLRILLTY
jgi:hypothetical protein